VRTPETEAGRTLIAAWRHVSVPWMEQQVAAIEAEAIATYAVGLREAVAGLPTWSAGSILDMTALNLIERAAVLALLPTDNEGAATP
jgi:hypothetical protein